MGTVLNKKLPIKLGLFPQTIMDLSLHLLIQKKYTFEAKSKLLDRRLREGSIFSCHWGGGIPWPLIPGPFPGLWSRVLSVGTSYPGWGVPNLEQRYPPGQDREYPPPPQCTEPGRLCRAGGMFLAFTHGEFLVCKVFSTSREMSIEIMLV